jgi:putative transposase
MPPHRKRIKHYHEPGDLHEFTFSCYQRMPLLTNDVWREMFCRQIDRALRKKSWRLVAFVLMPEHVHLLAYPTTLPADVDLFLSAVKQPYSSRIRRLLKRTKSLLLKRLTIRERPDRMVFRYWQEGPGYDRNVHSERAVMAAIAYLHENPVRRGLVRKATDWKWSSARWYASEGALIDADLPEIQGLPAEFWTSV